MELTSCNRTIVELRLYLDSIERQNCISCNRTIVELRLQYLNIQLLHFELVVIEP